MLTIPYGEDPYDIVSSYFQSDDGIEAYKILNKMIKGDSKPKKKKIPKFRLQKNNKKSTLIRVLFFYLSLHFINPLKFINYGQNS